MVVSSSLTHELSLFLVHLNLSSVIKTKVAFGVNSMDSLCERLTSKEALPLHRWTHIALVSEGAKLRLYLNGALDSPRNHTGMSTQRGYLAKHPLYVGKVRLRLCVCLKIRPMHILACLQAKSLLLVIHFESQLSKPTRSNILTGCLTRSRRA
jgi:hypothetical protein